MSKNILFVSSYTGLGGGETSTLTLAKHLHGYTPHLLVPRDEMFAAAWREQGWPVHIHPYRGASLFFVPGVWARFPITKQFERAIRENDIHIVHSDYHSLPYALPAAERAGIPCVWTCMGWWFRPKAWQRRFFQRLDTIFAHSEAIKRGFLGTPPFMPPEAIDVIHPGVDTTHFSPRVDGAPIRQQMGVQDCPLVVMVARFQRVKGHETFIRMAMQVVRRIPEAQFLIAGENIQTTADRTYQKRVLALASQDRRLSRRVHFLGHQDDVAPVLAAADVVVCPSHFESFGVVNVEAMACGKAIVSTSEGGPAEVVVDGVTGYLVPPKDPAAMADRVIELLYSENTRRSFGMAGRMRAQQLFSAAAAADHFRVRLDELASHGR